MWSGWYIALNFAGKWNTFLKNIWWFLKLIFLKLKTSANEMTKKSLFLTFKWKFTKNHEKRLQGYLQLYGFFNKWTSSHPGSGDDNRLQLIMNTFSGLYFLLYFYYNRSSSWLRSPLWCLQLRYFSLQALHIYKFQRKNCEISELWPFFIWW